MSVSPELMNQILAGNKGNTPMTTRPQQQTLNGLPAHNGINLRPQQYTSRPVDVSGGIQNLGPRYDLGGGFGPDQTDPSATGGQFGDGMTEPGGFPGFEGGNQNLPPQPIYTGANSGSAGGGAGFQTQPGGQQVAVDPMQYAPPGVNPDFSQTGINTQTPFQGHSGIDSHNPLQHAYENLMNDFLIQQGDYSPLQYYPGQQVADVSPLTNSALSNMGNFLGGAGQDAAMAILNHGLNAQQGTNTALNTANSLAAGGGIRDIGSSNIGADTVNAMNISAPLNQVTAQNINGPQGDAALMNAAQLGNAPQMQAAQLGAADQLGPQGQVNAQQLNGLNQNTINQVMNNPALSGAIDASLRDVTRNLTEQELPGNAMAAIGAGSAGSSRRGIMDAISTRGAMDRMADISSQMRNSAYNQGIGVAQQQGLANQGANLQGQLANQGTNLQAGLANQQANNTFGLQNAAYQQQAGLANQAMQGQYGMQNANMQQQANMANQNARNEMTGLNMGMNLQGQMANQQYGMMAQQFNNQQAMQASMANQQANLAAAQGNQQAGLQASMANQSSALQAAMANQQGDIAGLTNQLGAAQLAGQIGQLGTQNAIGANNMFMNNQQALANAGLLDQALGQQVINANMQEHMFNQTSPYYTMQLHTQALAPPAGMPMAITNTEGAGGIAPGGTLPIGQLLQGAAGVGFN